MEPIMTIRRSPAPDVETAPSASLIFPQGYAAGATIIVGVAAHDQNMPWVAGDISNTAGYRWALWGNVGFALDGNLIQEAIYYAVVPVTGSAADTITVTNPGSIFTVADAVVYSGLGAIDGPGGSAIGWGGPGSNATTGNYAVTTGDIAIGFTIGAPTAPVVGWVEREEDYSRPYTMFIDQVATSTTANASWTMNTEGWIAAGIAFKRFSPPTITRGGRINRGVR
jgi:hypothetical protein